MKKPQKRAQSHRGAWSHRGGRGATGGGRGAPGKGAEPQRRARSPRDVCVYVRCDATQKIISISSSIITNKK